jgi:hypothetical protein
MGHNTATSESLGMQEPPPVTSTLQMPQAVIISALMAIVDSQNSKSVPAHSTTSSVPQGLLEELQVQEANRGI